MIRILLVDDHAIVREGFKRLVEREADLSVVAEAVGEQDALSLVDELCPDLIITDLSLSPGSGVALLRALASRPCPPLRVVLSMHDGLAFVAEAFGLGVKGYVTKAAGAEELVSCLRTVLEGGSFLSSDLRSPQFSANGEAVAITPRERETLTLLVRGLVPKAAAAELGISEKTFYAHRASLMDKVGARNEREMALIAIEKGLI